MENEKTLGQTESVSHESGADIWRMIQIILAKAPGLGHSQAHLGNLSGQNAWANRFAATLIHLVDGL